MSTNTSNGNGLQLGRFIATVLIAVVIWLLPVPTGVEPKAWHLLAIFVATIFGLILRPLPMGAVVLTGMIATSLTGTLKVGDALSGFSNPTVWLIFVAFLFARAFAKTGLGKRIAFLFIRAFGHKTLGLGYALAASDLVLSPGIPSGTARSGGILFPITRSLVSAFGSEPGPTASKIGRFLMISTFQAHAITAAIFMTSMAGNPLLAELSKKSCGVEITWGSWAAAGIVPGIIALLVMVYLIYRMDRPEITETPEAREMAVDALAKMGPMTRDEWVVFGTFVLALLLWLTGSLTNIDATTVALFGLALMIFCGTITWQDVLEEHSGWETLVWFGGIVGMASMLAKLGFFKWFATYVSAHVTGLPWVPALIILALVYTYTGYFFASLTAHIVAMFVPFLTVAVAVGAPPLLAALILAFSSSLCVGLTHYGSGPNVIYFGAGYCSLSRWWVMGFIVTTVNCIVFLLVGSIYWKMIGLF